MSAGAADGKAKGETGDDCLGRHIERIYIHTIQTCNPVVSICNNRRTGYMHMQCPSPEAIRYTFYKVP